MYSKYVATVMCCHLVYNTSTHYLQVNNYIVSSYRDVIVITEFAVTKYAIRRASKAQNIVMY